MSYLAALLLALVWLGAAVAAGRTVLSLFKVTLSGSLESLLMSLMLGFAFVSYAVFGLGSAGLVSATIATRSPRANPARTKRRAMAMAWSRNSP